MRIVYSFSLSFGGGKTGLPELADRGRHLFDGILENIAVIHRNFQHSIVRIHYDSTVPVSELDRFPGVELRRWPDRQGAYLFWRFWGAGSEDVLCVRDADSLVTEREIGAVDEWVGSPNLLHAMHDHQWHDRRCIMGGMWGAKRGAFPFNFDRLLAWWIRNKSPFKWDDDQQFLARYVEPYMTRPDEHGMRGLRHAGIDIKWLPVRMFPAGRSPKTGFVGEKVFKLDSK